MEGAAKIVSCPSVVQKRVRGLEKCSRVVFEDTSIEHQRNFIVTETINFKNNFEKRTS